MQNLAPSRHAILGASSAYRWLACTPSARFEEQIKEDESYFAAEGTLAHDLAALILSLNTGAMASISREVEEHYARVMDFYAYHDNPDAELEYEDMYAHANGYAAFVMSLGGEVIIEREVDFSQFVPLGFGTCDSRNVTPDVLYVNDYKYGAGKKVSAKDNPQLKLYAIGGLLDILRTNPTYRPKKIVMNIYQPRVAGTTDPVSTWECTPEELFSWAEFDVAPKALIAIGGQGEFVAGDHCGFCKARTVCRAYYLKFADMLKLKDKREMDDTEIAQVLTYGSMVASWADKVKKDAIRRFETKRPIAGFKLVAGSSVRKFKNEDIVVDVLLGEGWEGESIFKSELRALTDIEKKLGAKRFAELFDRHINKVPYANTIAPATDDREEVSTLGAEEFDD